MAPDQNFPVIMGVLGRTRKTLKILVESLVFDQDLQNFLIRGLTENQESNECDSVNIPKVQRK